MRRRRKQCKAVLVNEMGSATSYDYCTRGRGHEGPHANALTQRAWVVIEHAKPVTYRYPYERMYDDTTLDLKGLGAPDYDYSHLSRDDVSRDTPPDAQRVVGPDPSSSTP